MNLKIFDEAKEDLTYLADTVIGPLNNEKEIKEACFMILKDFLMLNNYYLTLDEYELLNPCQKVRLMEFAVGVRAMVYPEERIYRRKYEK